MDVTHKTKNTVEVILPITSSDTSYTVLTEFLTKFRLSNIPPDERPIEYAISIRETHICIQHHFADENCASAYRETLRHETKKVRARLEHANTAPKKQLRQSVNQMVIDGLEPPGSSLDGTISDEYKDPEDKPPLQLHSPELKINLEARITSDKKIRLPSLRNIPVVVDNLNTELPYLTNKQGGLVLAPLSLEEEVRVIDALTKKLNAVKKELRKEQLEFE